MSFNTFLKMECTVAVAQLRGRALLCQLGHLENPTLVLASH